MRIAYLYPTWDKPSGGHKQIRLQASLLRELGVDTYLIRDQQFFTGRGVDDSVFYGIPIEHAPVPFERAGDWLGPDDVLMLPELRLDESLRVCAAWAVRVAVFNQGGFIGLRYRPPRSACQRIEFAIAVAPYVASLCRRFYHLTPGQVFVVPPWVIRPPFSAGAGPEPQPAVAYMPRRLPGIGAAVRERVRATHPRIPWVEIDGLPEPAVAERMRQCAVFFATQDREGFGLPALEAMACGCLVAGFPGTGRFPHPYATPQNGLWAPDRDVEAAAAAVQRAIELIQDRSPALDDIREAARRTLLGFTHDAVLDRLADLAGVVANRSYGARRGPRDEWSWRQSLFTLRLLYEYGQLGHLGRLAGWAYGLTRRVRAWPRGTGSATP
jgi:hypothetical protein